jgi:hypothetical protein
MKSKNIFIAVSVIIVIAIGYVMVSNNSLDNFHIISNRERMAVFNFYGDYSKFAKSNYTLNKANELSNSKMDPEDIRILIMNTDGAIHYFENLEEPEDLKEEKEEIVTYFNEYNKALSYLKNGNIDKWNGYIISSNQLQEQCREKMINNFIKYKIKYEILEDRTVKFWIKAQN